MCMAMCWCTTRPVGTASCRCADPKLPVPTPLATSSHAHCVRSLQVKNIRESLLEQLGTDSVPMVLVANKADIQPP